MTIPEDQRRAAAEEVHANYVDHPGVPDHLSFGRWFARTRGDRFRFDTTRGRWMHCEAGIWGPCDHLEAHAVMWARVLEEQPLLTPASAARVGSASFVEGALRMAATCLAVRGEDFDADPWLLGVPGGVVDLRTGVLLPPDPARLVSRCCSVAPKAGPTPVFDRFLGQTFGGDEELAGYVLRHLGLSLSGDMSHEQVWHWYGSGGNGKGVLRRTMAEAMGTYHVAASARTFTMGRFEDHPTEIAGLMGARLITVSELPDGARWNMERIKTWSGNEGKISARYMRGDYFEFTPTAKLLFLGNSRPSMEDVGPAEERRWNLVPFEHVVPREDQDPHLKDKLREELPQILHRLIRACAEVYQNGLPRPKAVVAASADYLKDADPFAGFLEEVVEGAPGGQVRVMDLTARYAEWGRKFAAPPLTRAAMIEKLTRRGLRVETHRKVNVLVGFRLRGDGGGVSAAEAFR